MRESGTTPARSRSATLNALWLGLAVTVLATGALLGAGAAAGATPTPAPAPTANSTATAHATPSTTPTTASSTAGAGGAEVQAKPGDIAVSLDDMGLGKQIAFSGLTSERDLTIAVPDGMTPDVLTGTLVLPTDLDRGWIEVISGSTLVDVVRFDAATAQLKFAIPLAKVAISARAASIRLVAHLLPLDSTCYDRSTAYPLTISAPVVSYSGTDTYAQTVAAFLPPILTGLTIDVRGPLSIELRQSVLSLSARVLQRYTGQSTQVSVTALAADAVPEGDATPLHRTIVVDATGKPATTILQTSSRPALLVSGEAGGLADQIGGLSSNLAAIAQSSSATFSGAGSTVQLAPTSFSFADLGIGNLSSTAAGTIAISWGLDQARLGGRVAKVSLDLRADYTPPPAAAGGLLSFSANGRLIATWATSRSGQLREHVTVGAAELTRFTTFSLSLALTGTVGDCGGQLTDTLSVDPQSRVSVSLGGATAASFGSLPQALVPTFDVAIDGSDLADLVRANSIVDGLQRETSVPLAPQLVSEASALAAEVPALLVYPTSDAPTSVDLPLRHTDGSKYTEAPAGTQASGSVAAPVQLGSIQVATDSTHRRVLLVATSPDGTGALLDKALAWLEADPDRWSGLSGNVLATAATGDPFTLSIGVAEHSSPAKSSRTQIVIAVVAGIVILLGVVASLVLFRRRSRRAGGVQA
jgi:hypothetical protein